MENLASAAQEFAPAAGDVAAQTAITMLSPFDTALTHARRLPARLAARALIVISPRGVPVLRS
jgi:ubiquinone biosynthesis protein UbiJ